LADIREIFIARNPFRWQNSIERLNVFTLSVIRPESPEEAMNKEVKDFVVNVLGCGCPEEVFSSILLETAPGPIGGILLAFSIRIGGRLMVLGVAGEKLRLPNESLATLVAAGMGIRDGEGFNRLRIVVISDDPEFEAMLRPAFARVPGLDERVHLHVVKRELLDKMLTERESGMERRGEMGEFITKPTVWHEMEGPFIGGREHYQEKSYGFEHLKEAEEEGKTPGAKGQDDTSD
jgi:hypothetical protein